MILFSLGPFGPFSAWWGTAIARIAEAARGPTTVVGIDAPEDFAASLVRSATPNLVVVTHRPSPPMRALLAESGAPLLVGFGDPREGLFELVAGHGLEFRTATQVLADSCTSAIVCSGMSKALLVGSDAARQDTVGILGSIAEFCGLNASIEQLGIAPPPSPSTAAKEWWDALGPDEQAMAEGALGCYAAWFAGHGIGQITWDRRLFRCAADHARSGGAAIDIGETPGLLVDGPWIGLPPGHWAASVTLAVSREVNGARFDIAVHGASPYELLATGSIICDGRGLGSATLLFAIGPSYGQTVSLTVASTAPAPGGRLAMGNVLLAPSTSAGAGIPAELSSALSLN
jgi:hypothetical protein